MGSRNHFVAIAAEDLATFQERVAEEEAEASEFVGNEMSTEGNQLANRAIFRRLDGSASPASPVFTTLGLVPLGRTPAWTGVVALGAAGVAVSMYRE
jgi:hypothetical protein